jgi:hypothetical protein
MAVRRLLGYAPQQLSADSGLTGRENVSRFARVFDVPRRERAERVAQALDALGLTDAAGRPAGTCSGGMVRRLELTQALVSAPRGARRDRRARGHRRPPRSWADCPLTRPGDVMCGTPRTSPFDVRSPIVPAHGLISDQTG